jgi:hypothetical protein
MLASSMPTDRGESAAPSGAEGDRTPDLCLAKAALSQLSYSPGASTTPTGEPPDDAFIRLSRAKLGNEMAPRERGADEWNVE